MVRREGAGDGGTCVHTASILSTTATSAICDGALPLPCLLPFASVPHCPAGISCYEGTVEQCRAGISPFAPASSLDNHQQLLRSVREGAKMCTYAFPSLAGCDQEIDCGVH